MSSTLGVVSLRHHAIVTEFHDSTHTRVDSKADTLMLTLKVCKSLHNPRTKKKKKVGFFFLLSLAKLYEAEHNNEKHKIIIIYYMWYFYKTLYRQLYLKA